MNRTNTRSAETPLELLLTIPIFGMLVSLLRPAMQRARAAALAPSPSGKDESSHRLGFVAAQAGKKEKSRKGFCVVLAAVAATACLVGSNVGRVSAQGVDVSTGKTYAYGNVGSPASYLPKFSGGTFYFDNAHVQSVGVFDTGDLTDGVTFPNSNPTIPNPSTITGWGEPATVSTEIIFDLGENFAVDKVRIGAHTWAPFLNGAPNDVSISFSTTGVSPGDFFNLVNEVFTAADVPANGHHDLDVAIADVPARFVKLTFDGGAVLTGGTPNKWMLDEVTVFGTVVPEPASVAIWSTLAMVFVVCGWRSRRRQ